MMSQLEVILNPRSEREELVIRVQKSVLDFESLPKNLEHDTSAAELLLSMLYGITSNASNLHVADAGCGTGGMLRSLQKHAEDSILTGIDSNVSYLKTARQRTKCFKNITYIEHDLSKDIDFSEFDVVYFHRACGQLSDYAIKQGVRDKVPTILGFPCCYFRLMSQQDYVKTQTFDFVSTLFSSLPESVQTQFADAQKTAVAQRKVNVLTPLERLYASNELKTFVNLSRAEFLQNHGYTVAMDRKRQFISAFSKESPNLFK